MYKQILLCLIVILLCVISGEAQRGSNTKIALKTLDIRKVNFKRMKHRLGEDGLTQKDIGVLDTKFGDLNGDGKDEAVVHISWSFGRHGGSGHGAWIDVFTVENNKLKVITRLDGGSGVESHHLKILNVKDSQMVLERCEYEEEGVFFATIYYKLSGNSLNEVKKIRIKAEEGDDNCSY